MLNLQMIMEFVQAKESFELHNDNMSYGNLSDFEEILSDGDVPF